MEERPTKTTRISMYGGFCFNHTSSRYVFLIQVHCTCSRVKCWDLLDFQNKSLQSGCFNCSKTPSRKRQSLINAQDNYYLHFFKVKRLFLGELTVFYPYHVGFSTWLLRSLYLDFFKRKPLNFFELGKKLAQRWRQQLGVQSLMETASFAKKNLFWI